MKPYFACAIFCSLILSISSSASTTFHVQSLSQSHYWLKLGHYITHTLGGYRSTIDSAEFFIANDGKTNPRHELEATIKAFYYSSPEVARENQCHYPARYRWLESIQGRQAHFECPEMAQWEETIAPKGLTLVFPTAFMNNPSSMFGHTLLRIDAKDQTRNKELVAFAVNFAANPDTTDNAALYALKGLIGQYPGTFTVMPYYRKVREYNDIESRDIWEYPLNFSTEEVHRILLHLWEMKRAEFDYYFLDENCSYQLLALLQLANDDIDLTSKFPIDVIPSDTVKALVDANLTEQPHYRAAFGTRLLFESDHVSDRVFFAAKKVKDEGTLPDSNQFTNSERAAILELAYEWLNFELYDQGLERKRTAKRLTQLLVARSQINAVSPFPDVPIPDVSPDDGHGSTRLGIGHRLGHDSQNISYFEWRPAYHDLYDNQEGFIPGAKISFLDTRLSLENNGATKLDHFYFMDAMAIAPSNRVIQSLAWNLKMGLDRPTNDDNRLFIQGAAGKAWGKANGLHRYFLLSTELNHGDIVAHQITPGIGVKTGILYSISDNQRVGIDTEWHTLIDAQTDYHSSITGTWNWSLTRNFALRTQVGYQQWEHEEMYTQLTTSLYF